MAAAEKTERSADDVAKLGPEPRPVPWPDVCRCTDPEHLSIIFRIWHRQLLTEPKAQQ